MEIYAPVNRSLLMHETCMLAFLISNVFRLLSTMVIARISIRNINVD